MTAHSLDMLAWYFPMSFERASTLWLLPPAFALVFWLSRRSLAGLSPGRWWAANITRCVVLLLLLLAMAGAQWNRRHDALSVIYVVDQSRSIPEKLKQDSWMFVRETSRDIRPEDRTGLLSFDADSYIEQLPQKPGPDGGLHVDRLSPPLRADRTDLAQAMRMAMAMFPQDTAKRMVVLTDANQTQGDVLTEIRTAAANNIAVDVVPLRYKHRNEVMFEKLQAPAYAHLHDQIPLKLLLRSERPTTGRIMLYHDGVPVDPTGKGHRVELQPGVNPLTIRLALHHTGAHKFEARFEPDDPTADEIVQNNVARAFTNVEGEATVLYLHHPGGDESHRLEDDQPLIAALESERIRVVTASAAEADMDPARLQQYSAVILANVPADAFNETQHRSLASYVRDLGGGLIMVGGDDSYGAGGWQGSAVEDVMPVRFDVDETKQIPRGALVVIMHACEMPQGNMWTTETCLAALKTLSRLDYFGVVDWTARGYDWAIPLRLADDKKGVERQIRKMQSSDMPDYHQPMDIALTGLKARTDASQKHVIMISDGDASAPSPALLNKYRGAKVTVSTVSVFPHGNREIATLKDIAHRTGGKYHAIANSGDEKKLPQIFIKEAKIVRRPLIREAQFQPKRRSALSEILDGITGDLPTLNGYVVTTPRSPAEIDLPLVSDKGDPILAHWQRGLGRTVAFTSGWWTHWCGDWPSWPGYSKLWAQAVRWCMSQGSAANFEVMTRIEGDVGKVVIEALNKETAYLNFLQIQGNVLGPDGRARSIQLEQTGPGRYEADFPVSDSGTYLVNVHAAGGDEKPALIRTGVSVSYSQEFRQLGANETLLRQMADLAAFGRLLEGPTDQTPIFEHNLPETVSHQPIWHMLLALTVALFLIDVAVRRIAVDPRAVARRMRGFIADLAGRFAPGRQAEVVLGDLKVAREKVRAEKTAAGEGTALAAAREARETVAAGIDRGRKFEAGADAPRQPAGDLGAALGGATAVETQAPPTAQPGGAEAPAESVTERLLKAKKRARGQ